MHNTPHRPEKIRKAIIPAAGLGTRFLPATKALPKEMLPIVDVPTIQYVVEEAVNSGIEEILIITNSKKQPMENHFDRSWELEYRLSESGKTRELEQIREISELANIYYVRQKEQRGLGHAVLCAKSFIGGEAFAVLLGDDVVVRSPDAPEATAQLISAYEQTGASILGVQEVEPEATSRYGIIAPSQSAAPQGRLRKLAGMVEKPRENPPSRYAVLGRYVLTPEIFDFLETQEPGAGGEIQLTDAICRLMTRQVVYAYDFVGTRYDVGDKFGFLRATIDFALAREEFREDMAEYIKKLAAEL